MNKAYLSMLFLPLTLLLVCCFFVLSIFALNGPLLYNIVQPDRVQAAERHTVQSPLNPPKDQIQTMGMHILTVHELSQVADMLHDMHDSSQDPQWHYVTIPFTLADLNKLDEWQSFFATAREKKLIPLVRLTTQFVDGSWQKPTRQQIVSQIAALSALEWPTKQRHIIVFNEVNHAAEWGGDINPTEYAEYLSFTTKWAKTEHADFVVLPAAMDLAAPNGPRTMEAFTYLSQMLEADPDVFAMIDIWNSHSYPNPAFSSAPTRTGQNSLRGFEYELEFVAERAGRDLPVMITETGWDLNNARQPRLTEYYTYTLQHIWSDSRVLAVTPFIMKGDPGPFSGFGFIDQNNKPTYQYYALQEALRNTRSH